MTVLARFGRMLKPLGLFGSMGRRGATPAVDHERRYVAVAHGALMTLGGSLTNALSEAYGQLRSDVAQHYVATVFWTLGAIGVLMTCTFVLCWPHVEWATALGAQAAESWQGVGPAVLVAILVFFASLPLTVVPSIYFAHQEGEKTGYGKIGATVAGFVALLGAMWCGARLVRLVTANSGASLVVTLASAAWLFGKDNYVPLPEARAAEV